MTDSKDEMSFQEQIKDRFTEGLRSHFNDSYEDWLEWCDTLYEPDAHYNVNSNRLTLQEYKDLMSAMMSKYDIKIGEVKNMVIENDWGAIRYAVRITDRTTGEVINQMTMEFVQWKDNPQPIGARVIEGWALSDHPLSAD
ncbi:hypothetical protein ACFFJ7_17575 [Pseudochelatococcus lubricantis]|uniref:hypothetical protein n=1 Tax=Pseudochelatococcus lubricantis TaxID=1538102 RepID=UPI0035EBC6E1